MHRSVAAALPGDGAPLECVAFLLVDGDRVLAEQRSPTKRVVPGALAIPGGHVESGESTEEAVVRELHEELGLRPRSLRYVCTLLHRAEEFRRLHYFAVDAWDGEMVAGEADALRWVPLREVAALDLDVDRLAVAEYGRVYGP